MEDKKPKEIKLWFKTGEEKSKVNIIYGASRRMPTKPVEHDIPQDPTYQAVEQKALRAVVLQSVASLKPREQTVVRLRWGLDNGSTPMTLEQVAQKLGFTAERIRQIEDQALKKLRHPYRSRPLRSFVTSRSNE